MIKGRSSSLVPSNVSRLVASASPPASGWGLVLARSRGSLLGCVFPCAGGAALPGLGSASWPRVLPASSAGFVLCGVPCVLLPLAPRLAPCVLLPLGRRLVPVCCCRLGPVLGTGLLFVEPVAS